MLKIITFANNNFIKSREILLSKIKKMSVISELIAYGENDLDAKFRERYKNLLSYKRGYGYWIWKPFLIYKALLNSNDDDIILYIDSTDSPSPKLFDYINTHFKENDILLFKSGNLHDEWTKRDCFILMNCDDEKYHNQFQLEAGIVVVRKTKFNISLIKEWLKYCSDIYVVSDLPNKSGFPNYKGFREHRHDQSILTNLSIKYNIPCNIIDNQLVECNSIERGYKVKLFISNLKLNLIMPYDFLKNPDNIRKKIKKFLKQ